MTNNDNCRTIYTEKKINQIVAQAQPPPETGWRTPGSDTALVNIFKTKNVNLFVIYHTNRHHFPQTEADFCRMTFNVFAKHSIEFISAGIQI